MAVVNPNSIPGSYQGPSFHINQPSYQYDENTWWPHGNGNAAPYVSRVADMFSEGYSWQSIINFLTDGAGRYNNDAGILDLQSKAFEAMLNERYLGDQRAYDSPRAQMQRLLATGMSREAAFAALTGGQQPISSPEMPSMSQAMLSDAQRRQMDLQNELSIAQSAMNGVSTVFGAAGSIMNMAQVGIAIPQMINQTALSNNAVWLSDMQRQGLQDYGNFSQLVSSQMAPGATLDISKPGNERVLDSFNTMVNALRGSADPIVQQYMKGFDAQMSNPFFRQNAEAGFNHNWSTAGLHNTPEVINNALALQRHDVALKSLGVEDLAYKVHTLNFAEFNKLEAETGLLNEQINTQIQQQALLGAQKGLTEAQTEVAYTQNDQLSYQNDLLAPDAAAARGLLGNQEFISNKMDMAMSELYTQLVQWQAMANMPDQLRESVNAYFANTYNQAALLNWQARAAEAEAKYRVDLAGYNQELFTAMDQNGFTRFIKGFTYMRNNTFVGSVLDEAVSSGKMLGGAMLLQRGMQTHPGYFGLQTNVPMSAGMQDAIRKNAGPGLIIP